MITLPQVSTLGDLFAALAAAAPGRPTLRSAAGPVTSFADFQTRGLALCAAVTGRGVEQGARVAILSRNRTEMAETFALARQGLVIVPLNWRLNGEALVDLLADCQPSVVFADREHREFLQRNPAALQGVSVLACYDGADGAFEDYQALIDENRLPVAAAAVAPSDPVCLIYTSGTTGQPKGAALSHAGVLANMRIALRDLLQLGPDDRVLAAMPFFHVGGLWFHFFPSFAAGCGTTILPEFKVTDVLDVIERDRISVVHLVPTMLGALIEAPDLVARDLSSLRRVFYAGSPMPTALLRRAMQAMPACEFLQSYGSTEAGILSVLTPADHRAAAQGRHADRLRSCGRPVPEINLRIAGSAGPVAQGQIGEIEVQGLGTILGYWNNPRATAALFSGAHVRTGDLGYLDGDGYLHLVERKNDMIVTGGENVYPTEVEEHLSRLDGVLEAAVFGVPHPRWIEQVTAVVVPVAGVAPDAEAMTAKLRTVLAPYKCPKAIFFAPSLPKNGVGKVLRARLRDQYAAKGMSDAEQP